MKFASRINGAKSFPELRKVIEQAKACNELRDNVLHEAIKKLDRKECKNVSLGHELSRQIPINTLPLLDSFTLRSILNCASQAYDFTLTHQVFRLTRNPNSYTFYYYVNSFKKAKANELSPEMIEELGSLWKRVEQSGNIENDKLLNQLFSVLSFSKEKQHSLMNYIMLKPANISFTCVLLGNFLKYCAKNGDLDLARKVWDWGHLIREKERGTFGYFLITYQYYSMFPPPIGELQSLWSQVRNSGLAGRIELVNSMCNSLSVDILEQRMFINDVISKEPDKSFDCGLLRRFFKHCSETNDFKLAKDIWHWGQRIRDHDRGTFGFFLMSYQYYNLFPPSISELQSLWCQVVSAGLNDRVELVTSMCLVLSADLSEQRNFINDVISKEPDKSLDCVLLGVFLKHCSETKDLNLAKDIWLWGQRIRDRYRGTYGFFLITQQYYNLFPPSISELKSLWSQVVSAGLNERVELVTFMCSALSADRNEQRNFILSLMSNPAAASYHCGVIGTFLSHCADQNNLELARRIWSWGLDIRSRWKGTSELCQVTIQYLCICKGSGDLSLLEEVWKEAKVFGVGTFKEALGAFMNALAANGAVDRVLELFSKVPSNIVDEYILASTLNCLSHTSRDVDSLDILRRVQSENSKIVSVNSYNSVIDAFARNGNFKMVLCLIEEMKQNGIEPNAITWTSILSPCRFYKNISVALKAFEELQRVEHKPEDITSAYVLLADVYKSCGDIISANQLHDERVSKGLFKTRGGVQLCLPNSETISFYVNWIPSAFEPEVCDQIHETLDEWRPILQEMGLSTESVSCRHSEMLALAYAIIVLKLKRVFIKKNLRVCLDYCSYMKVC